MKKSKYFLIVLLIAVLGVCLIPVLGNSDSVQLHSPVYGIDLTDGFVGRIPAGTDPEQFLSGLLSNGQLSLSDGVKTGSRLVISRGGHTLRELELVVCGDCNGDGQFGAADAQVLQILLQGGHAFSPSRTLAADINGDGQVTDDDLAQMEALLARDLRPDPIPLTQLPECTVLIPGQSFPLATEPLSLIGEAVEQTESGITATQPGLAWISAPQGSMLFMVTDQSQTVTLPQNAQLAVTDSLRLSPGFSVPVKTAFTFESSDPSVATVDESGLVTALAPGNVTISCIPSSGQLGQTQLRVLPLAERLELSKQEIKVKNGKTKVLTVKVFPEDAAEPLLWTSSNSSIATVDENGKITGLQNGYVTVTCTGKYSGTSAACQVKVCDLIQVALTFDDGPSTKYTELTLDLLKKYDIPATFFMLGRNVEKQSNRDLVKRMAEEGHELGYHTWSHDQFAFSSREQIASEFARFQALLEEICGKKATVFRGPGGRVNSRAHEEIGLPYIYWSMDTRDWETLNSTAVRKAVLRGLWDGSIILLHDIHPTTYYGVRDALEYIMEDEDLDVEFLTVTELLSRDGDTPVSGVIYYGPKKTL